MDFDPREFAVVEIRKWLTSPSIGRMSPAAEAAYHRLLLVQWLDTDTSLPDDDVELARLSRLGEHWPKVSAAVRAHLEPHPTIPGRLHNVRGSLTKATFIKVFRAAQDGKPKAKRKTLSQTDLLLSDPNAIVRLQAPLVAGRAVKNWVARGVAIWESKFGKGSGARMGGRIGKCLAPLVKAHSADIVLAVWEQYVEKKNPDYCTPNDFASRFAHYTRNRGGGETAAAKSRNAAREFLQWLEDSSDSQQK